MNTPLSTLCARFAICLALCLTLCVYASADQGNGHHHGRNGSVTVSISPISSKLQVGQSQQFTASVSGTSDTSVSWLVNGVAGGSSATGTISSSGLYTAPTIAPSIGITVTADSVAVPSASANALVSIVQPPPVSVTISPTSAAVQVGQSQQFTATISGTSYTGFNWLVNGVVGGNSTEGTISTSGMYTAPQSIPAVSVTVTAQSSSQSTASASASVSITPSPVVAVSVSPASASLQVGHSQQFSASVSGTSNTGVNWMVNGASGGNSTFGSITSSGMYTAPMSVPSSPTVTITAQSAAQNTASANASVSITPAAVSVSISPLNATVLLGQSQQFNATVSGASNSAVTWLVSGILGGNSSVGTVTPTGLYTAPGTVPSASVVVTAESSANPSSSASANITIPQPVAHDVSLSWTPSSSPVAGYNVYRGSQATGPFSKINPILETATVYKDSSVSSGQTYYYATTSVDSTGAESGYSNVAQASIP